MSRKLIVSDGRRERELLVVSKIVVGRDPTCDLSEADPLLSRRHAEFAVDGDDIVVRDLGSRNGIYLNGARTAEGVLQSGDIIRIGRLHVRYIEDASPLASVPELSDDATGIVFPGPRPAAASPAQSSSTPKPPLAAKPATPPPVRSATPRPAASHVKPAPPEDTDEEATSYVSASGVKKAPTKTGGMSFPPLPQSRPMQPFRTGSSAPPKDSIEGTKVVPPPAFKSSVQPPIAPPAPGEAEEELTSYRPRTAVQPIPSAAGDKTAYQPPPLPPQPGGQTAVQPPPEPLQPSGQTGVQPAPEPMHAGGQTAVQPPPPPMQAGGQTYVVPPPLPPEDDVDEPTSFMAPRPRTAIQPPPDAALRARAVVLAIDAIAVFLGKVPGGQPAGDAVKKLESALAAGVPTADLIAALKELAQRLGTATSELS